MLLSLTLNLPWLFSENETLSVRKTRSLVFLSRRVRRPRLCRRTSSVHPCVLTPIATRESFTQLQPSYTVPYLHEINEKMYIKTIVLPAIEENCPRFGTATQSAYFEREGKIPSRDDRDDHRSNHWGPFEEPEFRSVEHNYGI